ncbi:PIG-L deacetylase family protein [Ornithinimicrobium sediminis]|uniref:PIG-L deacetylase family protein n=1 Tax=Ornithinimicrobium sediminis TaxID=2904603 RepID=UPI001E5179B4|nr:PIG-L deacetylase family protein [Ornithinimicrobium sediminis]MCE0485357.1 PIG-L family deacetylase [Ornithinimicrobium sediminis]
MATLETFPEDWQTALCVAAHPDDLEYGIAAAVARWTAQGKTVTYLLATRGEAGIDGMHPDEAAPVREQEEREGAAVVGVDAVEFLGLTDGTVEYGLPLRRALAGEIRRRRPDVVLAGTYRETFAGGGLNQADHRAVGLATLDACADAGNRWIFTDLLDAGLEPWSGVRWLAFAGSPEPSHAVDVSDTFESGVASLEAHRRYLDALGPEYPTPRRLLEMILGSQDDPELGEHTLRLEAHQR